MGMGFFKGGGPSLADGKMELKGKSGSNLITKAFHTFKISFILQCSQSGFCSNLNIKPAAYGSNGVWAAPFHPDQV